MKDFIFIAVISRIFMIKITWWNHLWLGKICHIHWQYGQKSLLRKFCVIYFDIIQAGIISWTNTCAERHDFSFPCTLSILQTSHSVMSAPRLMTQKWIGRGSTWLNHLFKWKTPAQARVAKSCYSHWQSWQKPVNCQKVFI